MFRPGDSHDPSSTAEDAIQQARDALVAFAATLEDRRFAYDDRQQVADAVTGLVAHGDAVTDDAARLPWVPPEANPSSGELAATLRELAATLTPDRLTADGAVAAVEDLTSQTQAVHEAVRQAPRFPYAFTEVDVEFEHRKPVRSLGRPIDAPHDDLEVFAGPRARRQLETEPREKPETSPLWVGTGTRKGRDASIPRESLFEHSYVVGLTGTGKSTYMTNALKQVAEWGYGACFIDPKGDDSRRLMRILPEHRLDDVVWIEPSSTSGYVSGINFIDVGLPPDHDLYSVALSNVIEDLVKLLGAGDYWGPRMNRVARNLLRAMNEYNRMTGDSEPDLTLVDLYYVLESTASREEFAARVSAAGMPFVQEYTQEIAEMPDEDLEPLLGRFLPWVEDGLVRRMIAFRDGGVDIPAAIRDGSIMIVRMGAENRELKRMLGMAVIRRIWAQIRARAEQRERAREPFFLFADEFDNLAVADETIPTMFSESRSYRLSITAGNQYPDQLPDKVTTGMLTNSKSIISFNPGQEQQARKYNTQLGVDAETLTGEASYHVWMRYETNREKSDPFRVYTHPPFPPYRTADAAEALIQERIEAYGRRQPTAFEQQQALLFNDGDGQLETGGGERIALARAAGEDPVVIERLRGELRAAVRERLPDEVVDAGDVGPDDDDAMPDVPDDDTSPATVPADADGGVAGYADADDLEDHSGADPAPPAASPGLDEATLEHAKEAGEGLPSRVRELVLESIYAARVQAEAAGDTSSPGGWVGIEAAKAALRARVEATDAVVGTSLSELAQLYEVVGDDVVETARRDGRPQARLTDTGRTALFRQDTGSSGSGGSMKHRLVLRGVYRAFTAVGYVTSLPEQEGTEMPDGLAVSPIRPAEHDSMDAIEQAREDLQQAYPGVWALSKGDDVAIEAETSTQTYPMQTFLNLRKAITNHQLCVYATMDGESDKGRFDYWAERIARVHYRTSPDDGIRFGELAFTQKETGDGREVLYSSGSAYTVTVQEEGRQREVKAVRPHPRRVRGVPDEATDTKWYRDRESGEYVMAYAVNHAIQGEAARFPDAEAVIEEGTAHAPGYMEYDQTAGEHVVYTKGGDKQRYGSKDQLEQQWETFRGGFLPEAVFPRPPTTDDFLILIIPDEDSDRDQPHVYEQGETTPLFEYLDVEDEASVAGAATSDHGAGVGDAGEASRHEPEPGRAGAAAGSERDAGGGREAPDASPRGRDPAVAEGGDASRGVVGESAFVFDPQDDEPSSDVGEEADGVLDPAAVLALRLGARKARLLRQQDAVSSVLTDGDAVAGLSGTPDVSGDVSAVTDDDATGTLSSPLSLRRDAGDDRDAATDEEDDGDGSLPDLPPGFNS